MERLSSILKVSGSNVFKYEGRFDRSCYQVGRSPMILHDLQSIVHDMCIVCSTDRCTGSINEMWNCSESDDTRTPWSSVLEESVADHLGS